MKKTLLFEGAGCVPCGDLENCRIRTAFTNDEGKRIYLEISGIETGKHTAPIYSHYTNAGHVWHCFYITDEVPNDDCNMHRISDKNGKTLEHSHFEYCRAEILRFVNDKLHCSFEAIEIANWRTPGHYRVFGDGWKEKILMEDYQRNA